MVWIGPEEIARGGLADARGHRPRAADRSTSSRICIASWRPVHSASERRRYFSVTISRIGPTSWAMPPWTRTRLSCSCRRVCWRYFVEGENVVAGQQAAAADAVFRVVAAGEFALDELHARPDAAGVLPAAAGAAQPLAQDGARGDEAALVLR